jgi:N-acyl homoserine lactone hydrolase
MDVIDAPPLRLHVLDFGLFQVGGGRVIGIPGFLIVTAAGEAVLVDTGFAPAYAADPLAAARADGLDAFGSVLRLGPENLVAGQLARLGLTAADLTCTVLTHGHLDHAGGLAAVAGRPIVLHAAERAGSGPRYWPTAPQPPAWPEAAYVTVTGDHALGPGLTLLHLPGHVAGQLGLVVDLPEGRVVIASDALSRPSEPDEGFPGAEDPVAAARSVARLRGLGGRLIHGHCPREWPDLPKAPLALHPRQ